MRFFLTICLLVVILTTSSCEESKPVAENVSAKQTIVKCEITVTPNQLNSYVEVSATVRVHGTSKSAALKRMADDLNRMAADLTADATTTTAVVPENPNSK